MKLVSWNVNGLRAVEKNGFLRWFESEQADVVCVQEIKAFPEQLSFEMRNPLKYSSVFFPAKKPGYSGVAIYSKREPISVKDGLGVDKFDDEGRVLAAEFPGFVLVNAYFPNSQRDHARLPYKLEFCREMFRYLENLRAKGKHIVLCGDFNIAHRAIDLKNPKSNEDNAGFLPEERAWMDEFTGHGYIDTFRAFTKDPDHYTWWSYRPGVREKNIGWRLDYHCVNPEFSDRLVSSTIQPHVRGSDHCPIALTVRE